MLVCAGFILGAAYSNWTYDYYMLWVSPTPADMLEMTIQHYKAKALQPAFLHHVLHGVFLLAGLAAVAKLFRATESNTLFDGGSLFLFFICAVFYVTNLIPASYSLRTGDWGDIDIETGVKFISASQILMVFSVFGVLSLQFGQWWAGDDQARGPAPVEKDETEASESTGEKEEETVADTTVQVGKNARKRR